MTMSTSLAEHLMVAMPSMTNPNFERTVIYICEHHSHGTVGLIINRPMPYPISLIFDQMKIEFVAAEKNQKPLLFGGPLQPERGFVIHRPAGSWRSSLLLHDDVTITTSSDIIRAIAGNTGPKDTLITLGYTGWIENQLETEVINNFWLVCPYKPELLYEVPYADRWTAAGKILGIDMNQISSDTGHA